jgi:hypothetical protein
MTKLKENEMPLLSEEARIFLTTQIENSEDLDVLCLLRSNSSKEWSALEVSDQLGIEPIASCNRLLFLHRQGLLEHPSSGGPLYRFRFHPVSEMLQRVTEEISKVHLEFHEALVDYVEQIHKLQPPSEKIYCKR